MTEVEKLLARKRTLLAWRAEAERILNAKRALVEKARGPKEFMGHAADIVAYAADVADFDEEIEQIEKRLVAITVAPPPTESLKEIEEKER